MTQRPTVDWQRQLHEQEAAVAAGTLDPASDQAWALRLFPAAFTADTDAALATFDRALGAADLTGDDAIWVLIEQVVNALNAVSDRWGLIETGEREELCAYIDDALTEAGVDVAALAARRRLGRHEITDQWRDW